MVSSTCSVARRIGSWSMSIADSTACSASSDQGGRRSRYASRGDAIENSTDELDIFPGGFLPARVAEQRRGVVGGDERRAVKPVQCAAQLADGRVGVEQCLRGERAEGEDDLGTDHPPLPQQI